MLFRSPVRRSHPANLVDRLDDRLEEYLPLAVNHAHLLLSKSNTVAIQLPLAEVAPPTVRGTRGFPVRFFLANGLQLEGVIYAVLPAAHSRVLDYLNRVAQRFVVLFGHSHATAINRRYVVGVVHDDLPPRPATAPPSAP